MESSLRIWRNSPWLQMMSSKNTWNKAHKIEKQVKNPLIFRINSHEHVIIAIPCYFDNLCRVLGQERKTKQTDWVKIQFRRFGWFLETKQNRIDWREIHWSNKNQLIVDSFGQGDFLLGWGKRQPHSLQRLKTNKIAARQSGRKLQNSHDCNNFAFLLQLRRNSVDPEICQSGQIHYERSHHQQGPKGRFAFGVWGWN